LSGKLQQSSNLRALQTASFVMVNSYLRFYLAVMCLCSFHAITEPLYLSGQKRSPLSPLPDCKRFHK